MTRIIAGDLKGREITVPKSDTRPTSSRVREAIFSATQHAVGDFEDLRVLDLYAGSGAYALESISRGAKTAVAIENDGRATEAIKANAEKLKVSNLQVVLASVSTVLQNGVQYGKFDLVFLDPPYLLADEEVTHNLELLCNGWLSDGALVIVERNKKSNFLVPDKLTELNRKVYGDTSVWYGEFGE